MHSFALDLTEGGVQRKLTQRGETRMESVTLPGALISCPTATARAERRNVSHGPSHHSPGPQRALASGLLDLWPPMKTDIQPMPMASKDTSFQGRLEDLSVGELLQVINYATVSGTLRIENSDGAQVSLMFSEGKLVAATSPLPGETMGSILVDRGLVTRPKMDAALAAQIGPPRRYLGEVLLEMGLLTQADLEVSILEHFKRVIGHILKWTSGCFQVVKGPLPPRDQFAWFPDPASIAPFGDLPRLLLEVAAALDEEAHASTQPDTTDQPSETEGSPDPEAIPIADERSPTVAASPAITTDLRTSRDANEVVALTERPEFLDAIDSALGGNLTLRYAEFTLPLPRSVLEPHRHCDASVFIVDGALSRVLAAVESLRTAAPLVPVVVVLPEGPAPCPTAQLWELGARVLSPERGAEPENLRAMVAGCLREAHEVDRRIRSAESELQTMLNGLHALREGADHASILSTVLRLFTEQMSRVILFVHRNDRLVAVAARGHNPAGRPELSAAIGCRVELATAKWTKTVVGESRPWADHFSQDPALLPLFEVIGAPAADEGILIPIRSLDRVVAILYGDNGAQAKPLGTMLSLEILALQAGLLFETIALHRHETTTHEKEDSTAEDFF